MLTIAAFLIPLLISTTVNTEMNHQIKDFGGNMYLLLTQEISSQQRAEVNSLILSGIQSRRAADYQKSIDSLQKALQLAQKYKYIDGEWQARTFLALTYKLMGNLQKAAELHEQNLVFVRQHPSELARDPMNREVASLDALSSVYTSQGNYQKAIEILKQILANVEKGSNDGSLGKAKIQQKLGVNLFLNGKLAEAEKTLSTSFISYENALKIRLSAGSPAVDEYEFEVEVIRWLQQVMVAQNRTDEALELAEKGRSRAFAALVEKRLGNGNKGQLPIAESPKLEQMRQIAKIENSTLVHYTVTYEFNPDLPLEFSRYEDIPATGLLIWVIKPTGEIIFRQAKIEKNKTIAQLVQATREAIGARGRGVAVVASSGARSARTEELKQLYQLLIQPIAELLPTDAKVRVTFVPQDLLFLVPFSALQDSDGKYLVEKHTILTAPAIQVLALTHQQQQHLQNSVKGVLIVGNPTMPSFSPIEGSPPQQLPSLPGAEQEARAIAQLFKTQALIGNQATKASVEQRMPQARIIHLATHGLLDDVGSFFSSLALAPSPSDNGFLTAREILSLKLNAELVVLSACNTGQGRITGDGVLGLSRSFIGAGVPSVIASLWSVPDAPTALLMTAFYKSLQSGADKAQALRTATLTTMKQYPSPLDWAAFTLIGEADASKTIQAAKGDSPLSSGNSTQINQSPYYTVFPVPENVKNYREFASRVAGEMDEFFTTSLSLAEIAQFYRQALIAKGLTEETALSRLENKSLQLVFRDGQKGKKIIIQATDLSEQGGNERTVSVRFE